MSTGKKLLISGFEPFGGSNLNSSQLVVEAISKESFTGLELSAVILPVSLIRQQMPYFLKLKR